VFIAYVIISKCNWVVTSCGKCVYVLGEDNFAVLESMYGEKVRCCITTVCGILNVWLVMFLESKAQ